MAWLKIYQWEHDTYPQFQTVKIDRHEQGLFIGKLARHFKVDAPRLKFSNQRGANAARSSGPGAAGRYVPSYFNPAIKLGTVSTLGTLCHEFAHHLDYKRHGNIGHSKTFKRELKRVYTWAKRWLPEPWSDWEI